MKKKRPASASFKSPNYTQVPNDFFDMIGEMDNSELRVTIVMIRETFGYHRNGFKLGIKKLADASGLSENGARKGAKAAEERGTFHRVNGTSQGSAEWELVVDDDIKTGWSTSAGGSAVTTPWSASDQQLPVKESIKENKKTSSTAAVYEANVGAITPVIRDRLNDIDATYPEGWFAEAVTEAVKNNVRKLNYIEAILRRWQTEGKAERPKVVEREPGVAFYA